MAKQSGEAKQLGRRQAIRVLAPALLALAFTFFFSKDATLSAAAFLGILVFEVLLERFV